MGSGGNLPTSTGKAAKMKNLFRFFKDESGATAIEYGLIAAAMGLALVTAMPILASALTGKFSSLAGHISSGT